MAAGGYRTVKVWQRNANSKAGDLPAIADVPVSAVASSDGKLVAIGLANVRLKSSMSALKRLIL